MKQRLDCIQINLVVAFVVMLAWVLLWLANKALSAVLALWSIGVLAGRGIPISASTVLAAAVLLSLVQSSYPRVKIKS